MLYWVGHLLKKGKMRFLILKLGWCWWIEGFNIKCNEITCVGNSLTVID